MRHVPIQELLVPDNRQRQEFNPEKITELTDSIAKNGLLQPLVVRYEDDRCLLVAGERRLRAIKTLYALGEQFRCNDMLVAVGFVPTVSVGELAEDDALEAELEENVRRVDLTWQEAAQAVAALHSLRQRQDPLHTPRDTAEEVTGSRVDHSASAVTEKITLASHLHDPDIARAKTQSEAVKILKRKTEAKHNERLAAIVGKTFTASDHTLLMGDCIEVMETLGEGCYDVILTDPPYGMGADSFGDGAGRLTGIEHHYADTPEHFQTLIGNAAWQIDRVAKKAAHLYVCCDIDQFHWLKNLFTTVGLWKVFRTPLINFKRGSGRVPLPEHGPRRQWEAILYAYRGDKKVTAIYGDVIESDGDDNLGHGAQKPVGLFVDLLRRSCGPGSRVLDPFCGTGTIFPAAHQLQCYATGIEREAAYFGISAKRIEELK